MVTVTCPAISTIGVKSSTINRAIYRADMTALGEIILPKFDMLFIPYIVVSVIFVEWLLLLFLLKLLLLLLY